MTMSTATTMPASGTTMPSTSWRVRPNTEGIISIRGRELESVIALNGVEMPTPAAVSDLVEEVQDTICGELEEIAQLTAAIKAKATALMPTIESYRHVLESISYICCDEVQPDDLANVPFYGDDYVIYDAGIAIYDIDSALDDLEHSMNRVLHEIECGDIADAIDCGEYLIPDKVEDAMKALAAI